MKRLLTLLALVLCSCAETFVGEEIARPNRENLRDLTAQFAEEETRTYVENGEYLRWHEDDRLTAFYGNTLNRQYKFNGATGDNSGTFSLVPSDQLGTGNSFDRIYAVYPYDETATITETGEISLTLPAVQNYAENSFGRGANTMIAVTENVEDTFLSFKNACGYLKLKLYNAEGATIKSIEVMGNNEERLAGAATVITAFGEAPQLTMAEDATTSVRLDCGEGVTLGTTAETATEFWIVLPATTFAEGLTIIVVYTNGGVYEKSTSNKVVIERNAIQPMSALETEFVRTHPFSNEIWYTATSKIEKEWTSIGSGSYYFGATIVSHEWDAETGKGVITFDNDVTTIGYNALMNCISLTSVTIPDSVTTISGYAFAYCSNLSSVIIPDSVTVIGAAAFCGCSSLTSIPIPDGVTTIYDSAFGGCSSLTSITIPDSVTTIGSYVFSGCSGLTSITIPDSVTEIDSGTFSNCSNLINITIPDGVIKIWDEAFSGCSSLTSVTIPNSVTLIGKDSFSGCTSLTSVYITDLSAWCKINFMSTYAHPLYYGADFYLNNELVTDIVIPNTITEIKPYTFYNCSSLTSVNIPDGVTTIGEHAFSGCNSLIEFKGKCASEDGRCVIIDGVLNSFAPAGITEYSIPDSVTEIGDLVFYRCSSLTSITIPDSVTSIGRNSFAGCVCELIVNCDVPDGAFHSDFTKITIGDGVTTIGTEAFSGCSNLTSLTIGKGVTTIGADAFEYCTGELIVNCNIPSALGWSSGAFYGSKFTKVIIGNGVTTIGNYAFCDCSSLTSVTISDSVISIGEYTFNSCSSLTSVNLPDSVTNIGEFAFAGCKSLTSITIPDSVTTNGRCAFLNCNSLTSVYCKPITPPNVTLYNGKWSAFDNSAADCKIYVPAESVSAYKSAEGWSEYASYIVGYDFENGEIVGGNGGGGENPQDGSYTVDLNNAWRKSTSVSNPDSSLYDGVYESYSNYNEHSSSAWMYINIEGYDTFTIYVRSYAESNYDYVKVYDLDSTTTTKVTTKGNQQSGTSISSYTPITFSNIGGGSHRIAIEYMKDYSQNSGNDRGYLLIPKY